VKSVERWWSERVGQVVTLARWGWFGTPVLLFPTAGGDAEEIERFQMIDALGELIEAGHVKIYSVDSVAGAAWIGRQHDPRHCGWLQNQFDSMIRHEVVPAIRADCRAEHLGIVTAGASIGAFNAVATVCRHPDVFTAAIGMSGTYDLGHWLRGHASDEFYSSSPIHYLPGLGEGAHLHRLRERRIVLPTGEGRWEDPGESWRMAHVLGSRGVPNRVDPWGHDWHHDWITWRRMLPEYLARLGTDGSTEHL